MKLKIEDLKTERPWRALMGFDQKGFEKLLELFTASYLEIFGKSVAKRQADLIFLFRVKPSVVRFNKWDERCPPRLKTIL